MKIGNLNDEIKGSRSHLTKGEIEKRTPSKIDKMKPRILKMLSGWSFADAESLLGYEVLSEIRKKAIFKQ